MNIPASHTTHTLPPMRTLSRRPLPLSGFLDDPNAIALHRNRMLALMRQGLTRAMWPYLLARAGYSTLEQIERATDAELLALPSVGEGRLGELRLTVAALLHPPDVDSY
jgi:hypothetical protein